MTANSSVASDRMAASESPLHVVGNDELDLDAAARAVFDLLVALGQDPSSDDLADTPRRVASALAEALTPIPFTMTTFANDGEYDELVFMRDIPFESLCAHHLLPFTGIAHVAYLPGERVVGLSKLARVVAHFSRRLQTQERLTAQIADALQEALDASAVGVAIEATHKCMAVRGVRANPTTHTTATRGLARDDPAMRAELMELLRGADARRPFAPS
jgi:GTP cyclohydrolase I